MKTYLKKWLSRSRVKIGRIAFSVFLWSHKSTEEIFWNDIKDQHDIFLKHELWPFDEY